MLEAGVLVVSIKLIIMAYKNSKTSNEINEELHTIKQMLSKNDK